MAEIRAMRSGPNSIMADSELIGDRSKGQLKGGIKGFGYGAAAGAAAGIASQLRGARMNLFGAPIKPGTATAAAALIAGYIGGVGGSASGQYKANKKYLANKGIYMQALGFKRSILSDKAKKKYLSDKYQGGGYDTKSKTNKY